MDILIVPEGCKKLIQVRLPVMGSVTELQDYLYDEENIALYEIVKYSDKFRSWFLDNSFCKEGHLNLATKVDSLLLFLPLIMDVAKNRYMQLQDICMGFNTNGANSGASKLEYALSPYIDWNNICETQEIDNDLCVKFSETRTLNWLFKKHRATLEALKGSLDSQASKATLISHANDLIAKYLPKDLIQKFKDMVKNNSLVASHSESNGRENQFKKPHDTSDMKPEPSKVAKKANNFQIKDLPKNSVMRFFNRDKK